MTKTPNCPLCGSLPYLNFGEQAFCGNEDCKTLAWNPQKGPDQILEAQFVDLKQTPAQCAPDCDPGGNSEDHTRHISHTDCAVCPYHSKEEPDDRTE